MPRVSIGLPVFNGENYLAEALDSILAQTYGNFELVISDNASTDGTREICQDYASKDGRIRYHRNDSNLGAAANYNRVFHLSRARYFKWISHDDLSAPEFLDRCVEILDGSPGTVLCYPKTIIVDGNGRAVRKYKDGLDLRQERPCERLARFLSVVNLANAVFGLIRSDALRKTRLIGPYAGSDYILLMELCLQGKFSEIQEHLFFRRDHEKNVRKMPIEERRKWFDPRSSKALLGPRMKLLLEMIKAVKNTELDPYEKMLCYMQVRRWEVRRWRATGGRCKAMIKGKMLSSIKP
jgi:glycosyltransferase involved in cell wall biosynthesis